MLIDKNVSRFVVLADDSILTALNKISDNKSRVVFCVQGNGLLEGVLTDGDFRRWVVDQRSIDLSQRVSSIVNRQYRWASVETSADELQGYFSDRIEHLPLLDVRGRLVAVATRASKQVQIGSFTIDADSPTFTIAEIGINHNGSLDVARRLIEAAAAAGADCAKFQMRNMSTLYRNAGDANDEREDLGSQYVLDLLSRFSLTEAEMFEAFDHCQDVGILPLCTPWDQESVVALERYDMPAYKVASADLTNHDLLTALGSTGRPILISTGMSTEAEIIESVKVLHRGGSAFVLLHCNSTYPAPFKDVNLRYIDRLREIGQCPVGYSGHERGFNVAVAAVAYGAKVIEKHFTLDRGMEGNDHTVSLLPDEFRQMVLAIRQVEQAVGSVGERRLTQGEMMNRATLAKSLVVTRDLAPGDVITADMVAVRSPGRGLQPNRRQELIGRVLRRAMTAGDFFFPNDLEDSSVSPRSYRFRRPWGLPVRYHDYAELRELSNPDFLEFHLSYKDMDCDVEQFFTEPLDVAFTTHSPDLFSGDHILNLASADDEYRARTVRELQQVVHATRRLQDWFPRSSRPIIVVSMGGFTKDEPVPPAERARMYERIAKSLAEIDQDGVQIVAQTLPPFPWYLGGQLVCNLFVDPEDTAAFSRDYGYDLCLDVSHSKLACNHRRTSFKEFVDVVGPHVAHLHLVDALGVDGEGVQIGEGEIDFPVLAEQLDRLAPEAGFIPEIWQGHNNAGEDFWIALDRLEKWF